MADRLQRERNWLILAVVRRWWVKHDNVALLRLEHGWFLNLLVPEPSSVLKLIQICPMIFIDWILSLEILPSFYDGFLSPSSHSNSDALSSYNFLFAGFVRLLKFYQKMTQPPGLMNHDRIVLGSGTQTDKAAYLPWISDNKIYSKILTEHLVPVRERGWGGRGRERERKS